jgi:integrase
MPRSRPASNPLSFHKPTGQHYVTRGGKRIYLGADQEQALDEYHRLALGLGCRAKPGKAGTITIKDLANRFLESQKANWHAAEETMRSYKVWMRHFLADHPGLRAEDLTVEMFAAWKVVLRRRKFSPRTINHYLGAVRALYRFADDAELLDHVPRLKRVKNESLKKLGSKPKPLYDPPQIQELLKSADKQLRPMILLGLNCGFGLKDVHDLSWSDIDGDRVTLPRSKTGVCQTFLLWPETRKAVDDLRIARCTMLEKLAKRGRHRSDGGRVFITKYWRPWRKDAVVEQFRKLCGKANVPCYGFYRLRHCASTAVSLVANPHVQRKFMRHSQLQQQTTYTHIPDAEVDAAVSNSRSKLLGDTTASQENGPGQVGAA